jgi:hypothetical protein
MHTQRGGWSAPDVWRLQARIAKLVKKPIRTCRSLHFCELCGKSITLGERYHDGGYGYRAHVECVAAREERD